MTDLSRDARSLVARARVHEGPSPQDRARIRAKLEPAWAAGLDQVSPAAANGLARRWPLAKALVLLAVASWSPSQPQQRTAVDRVPPPAAAAADIPAQLSPPTRDASERALSARPSERVPLVTADVRASGQLAATRQSNRAAARRADRALLRGASARSEAEAAEGMAGDLHSHASDPQAVSSETKLESAPKLSSARKSSGGQVGATSATRGTSALTHFTPETPTRDAAALERPQNQAAPAQSPTEFKPQPIDDELAWIGAAQEALQNHKPSLALRLVEQHSFRFPDGALTQERLVVHTLALCALERFTAARRMLEVLEQRAPDAPIVARVRSNCGL
jgi:hypothetical protein